MDVARSVRTAMASEASELVRLRDEAARWLQARGTRQWTPGEVDVSTVEGQIHAGEWHVVRDGTGVVAALRLLWADPVVWGDVPPVAGYVHGLVVDRERGRGWGAFLLDRAGGEVRARGRTLLRLDCQEHNEALRRYYRRLGFAEVGRTAFGPGVAPVTRLERPTSR